MARCRHLLTSQPGPLAFPPSFPSPIGHAAWEYDGTLQWELCLVKPAEVDGFVGVAVEAYVHDPQPSDRQLVLIHPVSTYGTESGAVMGMARGVQW